MSRIEHLEAAEQRRIERIRIERRKPSNNAFPDDMAASLEECGKALGVTRERARQIEAKALIKLKKCPKHLKQIEWRTLVALSRYLAAKKRDDVPAMLRLVIELDELTDAMRWLRAARDGTLEEYLREVEQRCDEDVIYTNGFSASQWAGMNVSTWGHRTRGV